MQNQHVLKWEIENNKLKKEFSFSDFLKTLDFVNKVATIAEQVGHHPEIYFTWGKAIIWTTSHDENNTITDRDTKLAQLIDDIVND